MLNSPASLSGGDQLTMGSVFLYLDSIQHLKCKDVMAASVLISVYRGSMCFPWPSQIEVCSIECYQPEVATYPFSTQFHLRIQTLPLLETVRGELKPA